MKAAAYRAPFLQMGAGLRGGSGVVELSRYHRDPV
jgi:hypothetical protein